MEKPVYSQQKILIARKNLSVHYNGPKERKVQSRKKITTSVG